MQAGQSATQSPHFTHLLRSIFIKSNTGTSLNPQLVCVLTIFFNERKLCNIIAHFEKKDRVEFEIGDCCLSKENRRNGEAEYKLTERNFMISRELEKSNVPQKFLCITATGNIPYLL